MHVVIIGAYGSAGAAAADRLAEADADVELTLVDGGDPGGGLCILRGCMPSKEVLSAGARRFQVRHDERLSGVPEVDVDRVVERKDEHTSSWAAHRRESIHELAEDFEGVEFVHDTATFVDDRTVRAGGREFDADYVLVATGSSPNVPDLPGIDEVAFRTSADVLDDTEFPDSAVVMGFGYVGMELVPYLSEVGGTDVTVIEHDARPLDEGDPAFGDELVTFYEEAFDVDVRLHTDEQRVEATDEGVRLAVERDGETEAVEAEELYLFTGREPNLPGGLEHTSLSPGGEWVRDTMQARGDDRVFVVGDVNGREPVLHVAKEQAFTAARNVLRLARGDDPVEYHNTTHRVVFSGLGVFPFARVGHTRESAEAEGLEFVHVSRQASDDGVFKTKSHPEGLASLVVGADGTVLGYQGLHYHADVMAKTMQVVVETEMDVRSVPDRAYHPTTPEILDGLVRDAAAELAGR
jgi:dihydrolipoamide dehydrogenase